MDPLGPPAAFGQGAFPALGAPSAAAFMAQVPGFASPFPPPPPPGAAPTYQQPAMGWGGQVRPACHRSTFRMVVHEHAAHLFL